MGIDPKPLTLAEFLAWEERQPNKYEYRDGAVSAMAGASDAHGQIVSAATARVDSGDKLDEYQTILELEDYVLVDSRKPLVRIDRRNGEKLETAQPTIAGSIELRSLGLGIALDDIYEDVTFGG